MRKQMLVQTLGIAHVAGKVVPAVEGACPRIIDSGPQIDTTCIDVKMLAVIQKRRQRLRRVEADGITIRIKVENLSEAGVCGDGGGEIGEDSRRTMPIHVEDQRVTFGISAGRECRLGDLIMADGVDDLLNEILGDEVRHGRMAMIR